MAVEMPLSIANRRTALAVGRVLAAEAAQAVRRGMARDDGVRSRYVTHIFTAPHRGGGHRPAGIRGCAPPAGINAADARHQANALGRCPLPRHHPPMPVDPDLLAGYLLASLLLVVTPGPDMAFVLGQTLAGGARRGGPAEARAAAAASLGAAFRQGFVTNLLNPKVGLFFLALVPLFVDPARSPPWLQMLIPGPILPALAPPVSALLISGAAR